MNRVKAVVLALIAIVVVVVVLQNTESVETRVLFATVTMPRAVLLFVTFVAGVLVGLLGGLKAGAKPKG